MARSTLTEQDVAQLLADPSGNARADTAVTIAAEFNSDDLEYLLTKMGQLAADSLTAS